MPRAWQAREDRQRRGATSSLVWFRPRPPRWGGILPVSLSPSFPGCCWLSSFLEHLPFAFHLFCAILDPGGRLLNLFFMALQGIPLSPPSPPPLTPAVDLCPLHIILLPLDLGTACVRMHIRKFSILPSEPLDQPE